MKSQNQVIAFPNPNNTQFDNSRQRNMLTFTEAWDQVFERAISKDKLYAECRAGRVPHVRIGTKLVFRRDSLEAWFREQEALNFKG
jgi:hypothetical protein